MRCVLFILTFLFLSSSSFASIKHQLYQAQLQRKVGSALIKRDAIKTRWYEQLISHQQPELGTFKQRFYIDESLAESDNAPVFFYICGEATCTNGSLRGAIYDYAKYFKARLIALEHRYYGKSMPSKSFSTQDLQFLSTEQALSDLARFQKHMMGTNGWQGKWVAFGGSYPGSLSAFYRLKHPALVVGALASSAPVKAKANFYEYDAHIAQVLKQQGCLKDVNEVVAEIENQASSESAFSAIKHQFLADSVQDKDDFFWLLAEVVSAYVQYGEQASFCQQLASSKDKLSAYAEAAKKLYKNWGVKAVDFTPQAAMSDNIADYSQRLGMRQWFYQSCTEYGYWQLANYPSVMSARSKRLDSAYFTKLCQRLFEISTPVPSRQMNQRYYYPLQSLSSSQIYFTNGSIDPWSKLSLTKENGNSNNLLHHYFTIEGHAHCADLHSVKANDDEPLSKARLKLLGYLKIWLK